MRLVATTAAYVTLAFLAAAPAPAEPRYAAPEKDGPEPCVQAAPCSLKVAVGAAKSGEEVVVGSGSYAVSEPISAVGKNLYIHGDFSGPMPKISGTTATPLYLIEPGERVAYVDLSLTVGEAGIGFYCITGSRLERARVSVLSGKVPIGIFEGDGCTLRDDLIRVQGNGAAAIYNTGSKAVSTNRNLTVIANGANAVAVNAGTSSSGGLDLRNSILAGELSDIQSTGTSKVFVANSSFDTSEVASGAQLVDVGGNQTAAPLFVDAAKSDYREALGSPTIDAGVSDQLGALDLDGNARVIGAAPDIGAFEFVPPVAQIQSLSINPKSFKAKKGAAVSYSLSAAGGVTFTVERKTVGRKSGKKCVTKTRKNAGKKKCPLFKPVKGNIGQAGALGANSFRFNAKVGGKTLKPGAYKLVGSAGGATKSASFSIVK